MVRDEAAPGNSTADEREARVEDQRPSSVDILYEDIARRVTGDVLRQSIDLMSPSASIDYDNFNSNDWLEERTHPSGYVQTERTQARRPSAAETFAALIPHRRHRSRSVIYVHPDEVAHQHSRNRGKSKSTDNSEPADSDAEIGTRLSRNDADIEIGDDLNKDSAKKLSALAEIESQIRKDTFPELRLDDKNETMSLDRRSITEKRNESDLPVLFESELSEVPYTTELISLTQKEAEKPETSSATMEFELSRNMEDLPVDDPATTSFVSETIRNYEKESGEKVSEEQNRRPVSLQMTSQDSAEKTMILPPSEPHAFEFKLDQNDTNKQVHLHKLFPSSNVDESVSLHFSENHFGENGFTESTKSEERTEEDQERNQEEQTEKYETITAQEKEKAAVDELQSPDRSLTLLSRKVTSIDDVRQDLIIPKLSDSDLNELRFTEIDKSEISRIGFDEVMVESEPTGDGEKHKSDLRFQTTEFYGIEQEEPEKYGDTDFVDDEDEDYAVSERLERKPSLISAKMISFENEEHTIALPGNLDTQVQLERDYLHDLNEDSEDLAQTDAGDKSKEDSPKEGKDDDYYSIDIGMYKFPHDRRKELSTALGSDHVSDSLEGGHKDDSVIDSGESKTESLDNVIKQPDNIELPVFFKREENKFKGQESGDSSQKSIYGKENMEEREDNELKSPDSSPTLLSMKPASLDDVAQDKAILGFWESDVSKSFQSSHQVNQGQNIAGEGSVDSQVLSAADVEIQCSSREADEINFSDQQAVSASNYSSDVGMYKFPEERRAQLSGSLASDRDLTSTKESQDGEEIKAQDYVEKLQGPLESNMPGDVDFDKSGKSWTMIATAENAHEEEATLSDTDSLKAFVDEDWGTLEVEDSEQEDGDVTGEPGIHANAAVEKEKSDSKLNEGGISTKEFDDNNLKNGSLLMDENLKFKPPLTKGIPSIVLTDEEGIDLETNNEDPDIDTVKGINDDDLKFGSSHLEFEEPTITDVVSTDDFEEEFTFEKQEKQQINDRFKGMDNKDLTFGNSHHKEDVEFEEPTISDIVSTNMPEDIEEGFIFVKQEKQPISDSFKGIDDKDLTFGVTYHKEDTEFEEPPISDNNLPEDIEDGFIFEKHEKQPISDTFKGIDNKDLTFGVAHHKEDIEFEEPTISDIVSTNLPEDSEEGFIFEDQEKQPISDTFKGIDIKDLSFGVTHREKDIEFEEPIVSTNLPEDIAEGFIFEDQEKQPISDSFKGIDDKDLTFGVTHHKEDTEFEEPPISDSYLPEDIEDGFIFEKHEKQPISDTFKGIDYKDLTFGVAHHKEDIEFEEPTISDIVSTNLPNDIEEGFIFEEQEKQSMSDTVTGIDNKDLTFGISYQKEDIEFEEPTISDIVSTNLPEDSEEGFIFDKQEKQPIEKQPISDTFKGIDNKDLTFGVTRREKDIEFEEPIVSTNLSEDFEEGFIFEDQEKQPISDTFKGIDNKDLTFGVTHHKEDVEFEEPTISDIVSTNLPEDSEEGFNFEKQEKQPIEKQPISDTFKGIDNKDLTFGVTHRDKDIEFEEPIVSKNLSEDIEEGFIFEDQEKQPISDTFKGIDNEDLTFGVTRREKDIEFEEPTISDIVSTNLPEDSEEGFIFDKQEKQPISDTFKGIDNKDLSFGVTHRETDIEFEEPIVSTNLSEDIEEGFIFAKQKKQPISDSFKEIDGRIPVAEEAEHATGDEHKEVKEAPLDHVTGELPFVYGNKDDLRLGAVADYDQDNQKSMQVSVSSLEGEFNGRQLLFDAPSANYAHETNKPDVIGASLPPSNSVDPMVPGDVGVEKGALPYASLKSSQHSMSNTSAFNATEAEHSAIGSASDRSVGFAAGSSDGEHSTEVGNDSGVEVAQDAMTYGFSPQKLTDETIEDEKAESGRQKNNKGIEVEPKAIKAEAVLYESKMPEIPSSGAIQGVVSPTQHHTDIRQSAVAIISRELNPEESERRDRQEADLFQKLSLPKVDAASGRRLALPMPWGGPEAATLVQSIKANHDHLTRNRKPVGAVGFAVVNDDLRIPTNDFFTPGRKFDARFEHSSFPGSRDDRRVNFKTMSIKLSDQDVDSPLDLVLRTGQISPYCTADSMDAFQTALRSGKTQNIKDALLSKPVCMEATLDGVRCLPESYYDQHYYSPVVYNFRAADGTRKYLARFRVIPKDEVPETGHLQPDQMANVAALISPDFVPSTEKTNNYLREEYRQRLEQPSSSRPSSSATAKSPGGGGGGGGGGLRYDLQIQVSPSGDDDRWHNPCLLWNEPYHPWLSLATLTAVDPLPASDLQSTQFGVGRLPGPTLALPAPVSVQDFNSVGEALAQATGARQRTTETAPSTAKAIGAAESGGEGHGANQAEYYLYCVTGDRLNAGTTSNVFVSIVGTKGRTAFQKLQPRYKTDFERSGKATFIVVDKPVGELRYMKVLKEKQAAPSDWYLEYIILSTPYNNKSYTLPCYRWLTDRICTLTVRDGPGVLYLAESSEDVQVQRSIETSTRGQQLLWRIIQGENPFSMLPGYLRSADHLSAVPSDLQSDAMTALELQWREHRAGKFSLFKTILKFFTSRKATISVEFEKTLADTIADKYENSKVMVHIIRHWREDAEFGRQLINGIAPNRIQRLETLPSDLRVTNEMVRDSLGEDRTLEEEIREGRVFMVSFPDLLEPSIICHAEADSNRGSSRKQKGKQLPPRFICAPKVLLYSTRGEKPSIIPIAIQLSEAQTPNGGEPIVYTKRDDKGTYSDWMVAKMWTRAAATNALLLGPNLSFHLMMEPVAIALLRNLPAVHPVHKLLVQHLRDIVAINTVYRQHVLPNDGALPEVLALTKGLHLQYIAKVINGFDLGNFDGESLFRKRHLLTGDDILPGYWLRDDSLRHWAAIKDFVREIVGVYYKSDSAVASDKEFSDFIEDLRENGCLTSLSSPQSMEQLVLFLTSIVFICTSHQALVSRGLLDTFAYCPNSPSCMMKPPPTSRHPTGYTEQQMKEMLPNPDHVERFIAFVMLLFGGYKPAEVALGSYRERYFTEEPCLVAIEKFRGRLRQISEDIRLRNTNIDCPFEYLLPENVHQCFTV